MEDIISGTYFADDTGKIMVVKLQGYIDQTNSYGLQKVFNDIISSGCHSVIVDFSDVMYISSAGWGIFVGEIKHFRDNDGDIKLANMSPDIYEVYQMLEFYHIFEDFNTVEEAKKSYNELTDKNSESIDVEGETVEIQLDTDNKEEKTVNNILEISSVKRDQFEFSSDSVDNQESDSDEIEILIDENMNVEIDPNEPEENLLGKPDVKELKQKTYKSAIDLSRLPLHEKIKQLVSEYPLLNIWQIKKLLKDVRFGTVKINIIKLYNLLKQLDLETKVKRYRYYRSC